MRVYRPKRKRISMKLRLWLWERDQGRCNICGLKIQAGEPWEVEHVKRLDEGGADTPENMAPAHAAGCHAGKTRQEARQHAKADRQASKHLGLKKPSRPLPGSKASPWKKRMDGTVVRRGS